MEAVVVGRRINMTLYAISVSLHSPVLFDFKLGQLWDFWATMAESSPFSAFLRSESLRNYGERLSRSIQVPMVFSPVQGQEKSARGKLVFERHPGNIS